MITVILEFIGDFFANLSFSKITSEKNKTKNKK